MLRVLPFASGFTDYDRFMQTAPLMSKSDKKKAINLNVKKFENDVALLKLYKADDEEIAVAKEKVAIFKKELKRI